MRPKKAPTNENLKKIVSWKIYKMENNYIYLEQKSAKNQHFLNSFCGVHLVYGIYTTMLCTKKSG